MDEASIAWREEQPRLTMLAYNMLGVWAEAQDVVSAVGEQVLGAQNVRNWPAYLTTLTTRRAIDALRSARLTRTEYVGTWLPEPVDERLLPEQAAVRASMLRLGVLFLLEQLSPAARAAYVLHHALGFTSVQVAEVLDTTPAAVRQLLSRAAKKLRDAQAPTRDPEDELPLLAHIVAAIQRADAAGLAALLAPDVVLHSDGGGVVRAARNPVYGAQKVARFLVGVERKNPGRRVLLGRANGAPALLFTAPGHLDVLAVDGAGGTAAAIWLVSNPEKLARLLVET